MKAYLAVAAGTVLISVLCSVLVPEGKLKKTVTFALRMICLAALIEPVYSLFTYAAEESEELCDYSFICECYAYNQESAVQAAILDDLEENCVCDITIEYSGGGFTQTSVEVRTESGNSEIISLIYEYLEGLGYININVI